MLRKISVLLILLQLMSLHGLSAQDKQVVFYKLKDSGTVSAYTLKLVSPDPVAEKTLLQQTFLADKAIFDWKYYPMLQQIDLEVYNALPYATLVSRLEGLGYQVRTE